MRFLIMGKVFHHGWYYYLRVRFLASFETEVFQTRHLNSILIVLLFFSSLMLSYSTLADLKFLLREV